jgi:hypothetical protein
VPSVLVISFINAKLQTLITFYVLYNTDSFVRRDDPWGLNKVRFTCGRGKSVYRIVIGKPEGKRLLARPRSRCPDEGQVTFTSYRL